MKIGDVIASLRRKKRIGQKAMALELGISVPYLSQIENNSRTPSGKLLTQIASFLNIPLSSILFEVVTISELITEEERRQFLLAKPMIDEMIAILLSDDGNNHKGADAVKSVKGT